MNTEFLLTSLVVAASPGTGTLLTLSAGLSRGSRAAVVAALGCTLGVVPHIVAALTGLAAVLHTSAFAFELLKYTGAAYLFYVAWATLRARDQIFIEPRPRAATHRQVIRNAVLVNVLNPKLSIFFLAFLPQFVAPTEPHPTWLMVQLSLVFMAITFLTFALYGMFAARVRDQVLCRPKVIRWMHRGFAATLVVLGARLALTDR